MSVAYAGVMSGISLGLFWGNGPMAAMIVNFGSLPVAAMDQIGEGSEGQKLRVRNQPSKQARKWPIEEIRSGQQLRS